MKPVITLLFGVAFVYFIYGIFQFIKNSDSDSEREIGKKNMLYGIIGMVIMVSVFGIIRIVTGTIGAEDPTPPGFNENIQPNVGGGL